MLLLFDPEGYWESVSDEQMAAAVAEHQAFADYLTGRGIEFSGEAVQPAKTARTLRPAGNGTHVTDGPLTKLRQDIAGYYLVDCADMDEAVEIARRCPVGGGIEIRPVWGAPPA